MRLRLQVKLSKGEAKSAASMVPAWPPRMAAELFGCEAIYFEFAGQPDSVKQAEAAAKHLGAQCTTAHEVSDLFRFHGVTG